MRNGLENTNTLDKTNQLMVKKRFSVNNSEKKKRERERESSYYGGRKNLV